MARWSCSTASAITCAPTAAPASPQLMTERRSPPAPGSSPRPPSPCQPTTARPQIVALIAPCRPRPANLIQAIRIARNLRHRHDAHSRGADAAVSAADRGHRGRAHHRVPRCRRDLAGVSHARLRAGHLGRRVPPALHQPGAHQRAATSLDFELTEGQIAISTSSELHLSLPRTQATPGRGTCRWRTSRSRSTRPKATNVEVPEAPVGDGVDERTAPGPPGDQPAR